MSRPSWACHASAWRCCTGRRYESFKTRDEWTSWASGWRTALLAIKPTVERFPVTIGIENHKDFHAAELADLLHLVDSPRIGACVDFGNNLALLEEPLDTIGRLAPFVVTTHLKDMGVKPTDAGFELSEVPLGEGLLPLPAMIAALRAARSDVHLCLEMLTRDPLQVPYREAHYWTTLDRPAADWLEAFEQHVLGRATAGELPRITGLAPEAQVALEDEHVRRSMAYARERLGL